MRGTTWASPGIGMRRTSPSAWRGQRVFLRVGSANYAAKVWVNGTLVAEHFGGHLPFVAEITDQLAWDRQNVIAIAVENKQLPGARAARACEQRGRGVAGAWRRFPATTYDFFPYAGLHRPVLALLCPGRRAHRRRHGRHDNRRRRRRRQSQGVAAGGLCRHGKVQLERHRSRPELPRRLGRGHVARALGAALEPGGPATSTH